MSTNFTFSAEYIDVASANSGSASPGSLLVVALLLVFAISALTRGGRLIWGVARELLAALWSGMMAVGLMAAALVCVVAIAFSGSTGTGSAGSESAVSPPTTAQPS
ncbi:MAG: hypothetical protein M3443_20965 [Actinomycetota bacterium]|nr:hypothetical protein [Actinomycetota bacterium]